MIDDKREARCAFYLQRLRVVEAKLADLQRAWLAFGGGGRATLGEEIALGIGELGFPVLSDAALRFVVRQRATVDRLENERRFLILKVTDCRYGKIA